jgi:hypothetical protein
MIALTWASDAVSSSLPAGTAVSAAYTYRYLTRRGATAALAGWVLVATGILSGSALVSLALLGLLFGGAAGSCPLVAAALAAGALVAAASTITLLAWTAARPDRLENLSRRLNGVRQMLRRAVRRSTSSPERGSAGMVLPGPMMLRRRQWAGALFLAALNWMTDGGALAFSLLAVGATFHVRSLVLAYSLSQLVTAVPLLPGNIGVAEGSMALALICVGVHPSDALAATVAYRLVSFWLQLPIGWVAWVGLRRVRDDRSVRRSTALVAA